MKFFLVLFVCLSALCPLMATVELSESINDVFYRGGREIAGAITMTVMADDFAQASEEQPVFLRIEFGHGVVLSETLVDQSDQDPIVSQPIFLAMILESGGLDRSLAAGSDAVSVVRWVKGENSVWLKVQSSSSQWVHGSDGAEPPSEEHPVSWTLGVSVARYQEILSQKPSAARNRWLNSRDAQPTQDSASIDLSFLLDLSQSEVTLTGVSSAVEHDVRAYGPEADQGGGVYEPQNSLPIVISGNFSIGRGSGPTRFMSHITRSGHGFQTQIILANVSSRPISWFLTGMDETGKMVRGVEGTSAANETKVVDAASLFQEPVAWFAVSGESELKVTLRYQAEKPDVAWADVSEERFGSPRGRLWRIYPGNANLTWDGVALINSDEVAASVTVIQRDRNGVLITSKIIEAELAPGGKRLYVFGEDFQAVDGSYFEISSISRLGVTALRGTHDSELLWENQALLILF